MALHESELAPKRGTVALVTMGCAKNEVDSAHMAQKLVSAGYLIAAEPDEADVIVINSCSFIQAATEESIEVILDACALSNVREGRSGIIVAGCMPARYEDDLSDALPEVQAFVPCADEDDIVERVDEVMKNINAANPDDQKCIVLEAQQAEPFAYVKISDGCDRFCSYCTIPFIRGRYHSFPYADIEASVIQAKETGAKEIVLIAQDTGRWGTDLPVPSSLAALLERLAQTFPDLWFRVMYIQPEGITDDLIDVVARYDTICSYFDIPFQQVNPQILQAMNRKGSAEEYLALISKIRERIPDVALRTTLMVGFPGETEEQFEELKSFVEEAELDYVGLFAYSREEGTRAYSLEDQLDDEVKLERLQEIRDIADAVSASVISQRIGRIVPVLVCSQEEDGQWYGRTQGQAPEVDGVTYFDPEPFEQSSDSFVGSGAIISIRIEDTLLYEMEGSVFDECACS